MVNTYEHRAGGQGDTGLPPAGSRSGHVSHSLLMGTINFPDNGEGQLPDLNRVTIYNVLLLLCRSDWLALKWPSCGSILVFYCSWYLKFSPSTLRL